jgi:CDP-diglyceride synthetase
MFTKTVFGLIGMALFTVFVGAVVVKLKEPALIVVVLAGIAMMVYDFIEFLREKD